MSGETKKSNRFRKNIKKNWKEITMANIIDDETIEYVGILAKLALSEEEKEQAKKDMGIISYKSGDKWYWQLNGSDASGERI